MGKEDSMIVSRVRQPGGYGLILALAAVGLLAAGAVGWIWYTNLGRHIVNAPKTDPRELIPGMLEINRAGELLTEVPAGQESSPESLKAIEESQTLAEQGLAKVDPKGPLAAKARMVRGTALRRLGRHAESLGVIEEALRLCPPAESEVVTQIRIERALTLTALGKWEQGVPELEAVEAEAEAAAEAANAPAVNGHRARLAQAKLYDTVGRPGLTRGVYERISERHAGPEKYWQKEANSKLEALLRNLSPEPREKAPPENAKAKPGPAPAAGKEPTVWTAAGGPYLIEKTFAVPAGATLEIGPGTRVVAAEGAKIEVRGRLIAKGGDGDARILFVPLTGRMDAYSWDGIEFAGGAPNAGSALAGCRIESARTGVAVTDGSPTLENCEITRCGRAAVSVRKGSPRLANCRLEGNLGMGVEVRGKDAKPELTGCTLSGNRLEGLLAADGAAPALTDATVSGNRGDGLAYSAAAGGRLAGKSVVEGNALNGLRIDNKCAPAVEGATVRRNGRNGLAVHQGRPVIRGATVAENKAAGLVYDFDAAGVLEGCTITGNAGGGIVLKGGAGAVQVRKNRVTGHKVGILVAGDSRPVLDGNDLSGNAEAALANDTGHTLDAPNHYWGAADEAAVRKLIRGTVNIDGFRKEP
jgi:parallel beta-helix repeat protein